MNSFKLEWFVDFTPSSNTLTYIQHGPDPEKDSLPGRISESEPLTAREAKITVKC